VKWLKVPPSLPWRVLTRFHISEKDKGHPGAHFKREDALLPTELLIWVKLSDAALEKFYSNRKFFRGVNSVGLLFSMQSPRQ